MCFICFLRLAPSMGFNRQQAYKQGCMRVWNSRKFGILFHAAFCRLSTMDKVVAVILLLTVELSVSSCLRYFDYPENDQGLCAELILPSGYPCSEHTVQTKDGFLLSLQRVGPRFGNLSLQNRPPVLLQHGFLVAGDSWFLDSPEQSLGFLLADNGFDVWVGNVRGTRWSYEHISLSVRNKEFWDWSWQELALYDLAEMIKFVSFSTQSKVFYVGHSQGTIMALAAFTQSDVVKMVQAAALLCPITYLDHISAQLVRRMVNIQMDKMIVAMGFHQLNLRSDMIVQILDSLCHRDPKCNNLLTSITGKNCCFNNSRVDFYLDYEPHPSSVKNLNHLFQMIREGTFSMFDYGLWGNLNHYGTLKPPRFDLALIPESLPLWMSYGGNDALADPTDLERTLAELRKRPELLYLPDYGHLDFILSVNARTDIYDKLIEFFRLQTVSSVMQM